MTEIPERAPLEVTWHSFDFKSGRRGQQLRVAGDPTISRIIGSQTETNIGVRCWDEETQAEVPGWDAATLPGRTVVVALDAEENPLWAGLVLRRRSAAGSVVTLDLATLEAYFDRRFVTDHFWYATDQNTIITGLIADATTDGPDLTLDLPDTSPVRDFEFYADDDKTVLSALQELMGLDDGPDLTVVYPWADDDHTALVWTVLVRDHIGSTSLAPVAVFEQPGPVVSFDYIEDFSGEHGANDVLAQSSGEGDARPRSEHYVADDHLAAGWVKYEHRYAAATSVTTLDQLDAHAAARLDEMKNGRRELTFVAHLDTAPRLGQEFTLGDNVEVSLTNARFPARQDLDGAWQPGYTEVMRCVGWSIDFAGRRLIPTLRSLDG